MKTWKKHIAQVCPRQKIIRIKEITYRSNNPKYMGKKSTSKLITEIPITEDIPLEEYTIVRQHFDSTAFQSDDRFFSTEEIHKRHSLQKIKELQEKALIGYITIPIEIEIE